MYALQNPDVFYTNYLFNKHKFQLKEEMKNVSETVLAFLPKIYDPLFWFFKIFYFFASLIPKVISLFHTSFSVPLSFSLFKDREKGKEEEQLQHCSQTTTPKTAASPHLCLCVTNSRYRHHRYVLSAHLSKLSEMFGLGIAWAKSCMSDDSHAFIFLFCVAAETILGIKWAKSKASSL